MARRRTLREWHGDGLPAAPGKAATGAGGAADRARPLDARPERRA